MKKIRISSIVITVLLCSSILLPTHAFFWWNEKNSPEILDFKKQILVNNAITFSEYDFYNEEGLSNITITSLPDAHFGTLYMGEIPVQINDIIGVTALSGFIFQSNNVIGSTYFEVISSYADGTSQKNTITLDVLDSPNEAPLAKDMSLFTYKNIAITCYFDVIDSENDFLTFQITEPPARGAVTIDENGASSFVYTPYENKTGRDEFRYIATDSAGNISNEGIITIHIEKADTNVTYGDMEGHSAHKSAISLAESGVFIGECIGNTYLFHPDEPVTREEFLSLAMAVTNLAPLEEVTNTGFYDDDSIPSWSKGYVSAALLAGVVHGTVDEVGKPVFNADTPVTWAETSVILDNLLNIEPISDVTTQHWASQATANLGSIGVNSSGTLPSGLNRGEVAELLDAVLALFKESKETWLHW